MTFFKYLGLSFLVLGIIFFLLFTWFFVIGFGPEQYYTPDPYCDTEMAKDFSVKKLKQIKPGMDSTAVLEVLGRPLYITCDSTDGVFSRMHFQYTNDGKLLKAFGEGDQAWFNASVTFDTNGKVTHAGGCWSYD